MARPERPLAGRVVLVTRPAGQAGALADRLRALGASVEARPTIALVGPADPEPARRVVSAIARYAWIVFTSANGVRFFQAMLSEIHGADASLEAALAAIGPATARELERKGHAVQIVADEQRSEGLARALEGRVAPGEQVLLVRPEQARPVLEEALRRMGARPEAVAFYRNVAAPDLDAVVQGLCADRFDVVLLGSPSTLYRLLESAGPQIEALRAALVRTRLVAMGPVTARAVEQCGLATAVIASEPGDEGVVRAVRSLFT